MSKTAAVHMAVCLQIASEGKVFPGLHRALQDPPPGAAGGVGGQYGPPNIRGFLANVAFRLRNDTPPFEFKWSELDKTEALVNPLWQLEQDICDNTVEIVPAAPKQ